MAAQCSNKNDKGFRCLLWQDHEGDCDWDTPNNPIYKLEHRITVEDFINKNYSAEIRVYGPDGVVFVDYFAAKVQIDVLKSPMSLRYLVETITEVVGQS